MAATTSGAIKAYLEAQGLGVAVYRDAAPADTALPHITVREGLIVVPDLDGAYDTGVSHTVIEDVQVDLWQTWRDGNGRPAEDYALPGALTRALRAAGLTAAPTRVYGVTVLSAVRLLEDDENVVHHAVTVRVRRAE